MSGLVHQSTDQSTSAVQLPEYSYEEWHSNILQFLQFLESLKMRAVDLLRKVPTKSIEAFLIFL